MGETNVSATWDAVAHVHKHWPLRLSARGASGYMTGTPWNLSTNATAPTLSVTLPNSASNDTLKEILQPILDEVYNLTNGKVYITGKYRWSESWAKMILARNRTGDDSKTFPGNGLSKLITSWLWDEAAVQNANLKTALMNASDNQTLLYNDFTAGPGTHKPPFIRGGGNAVNPAWRKAFVRPAAEMHWAGLDLEKLEERKRTLKSFHSALVAQAPYMGSYGNEADVYDTSSVKNFYGANYARLKKIKDMIDPLGVFWCSTCVGSEKWVEKDGVLCLKAV
jgi:hypothetical protein